MSIKKHFISADQLLVDSFKLAEKVYQSGFRPDFIIGVWRGGAPIGIAIQEYFDYLDVETDHIAIRTSSYFGIEQANKEVKVHGIDYIVDNINTDNKVLLVDDVFDSGRSIQAILERLKKKMRKNMPSDIKVACPWYKPKKNLTDLIPDYFLNETDDWIVFPHELKGLTLEEIITGKPDIAKTITRNK